MVLGFAVGDHQDIGGDVGTVQFLRVCRISLNEFRGYGVAFFWTSTDGWGNI